MAYNFSSLLSDIYTELGQLRVGRASGGSASALEDSSLAGKHSDRDWQGGAAFILEAAGSAPESEFASVSAFDAAAGEFTLAPALSAMIEEGDRYGLASAFYPLDTMIELSNAGLRALGEIPLVDEQILQSSGSGSGYVATLEWNKRPPLRIDYLALPGSRYTNPWRTLHDWDLVPAAPGDAGLILFADALAAGRELRVWYRAAHPTLSVFDDQVADAITPELAVAAGVERALRWQAARLSSDAFLQARWERARSALMQTKRSFPLWNPRRTARILSTQR
jgi:hypothetical protein